MSSYGTEWRETCLRVQQRLILLTLYHRQNFPASKGPNAPLSQIVPLDYVIWLVKSERKVERKYQPLAQQYIDIFLTPNQNKFPVLLFLHP